MSDDKTIVIASAARTPVGSFNGAFAEPAGARARRGRHQGRARARRRRSRRGRRSHPRPGADGRRRARTRPARPRSLPASRGSPAWGLNQLCGSGLRAVALGMQQIATGDAKIIVAGGQECMSPVAARRASARRHEDGRLQVHRHHDQGRPVGRLQRLSHGQHGRERRPPVADHPRGAGRVRRRLAEQGRGRAEGRQVQGRDRAVTIKDRKGDIIVDRTNISATARRSTPWPS